MRYYLELLMIDILFLLAVIGIGAVAFELSGWPIAYVDARTGECLRVETAEGKSGKCAELPAHFWNVEVTRGR